MLKLTTENWMFIHIPRTSGGNFKQIITRYYDKEYSLTNRSFSDSKSPLVEFLWKKFVSENVETGLTDLNDFHIGQLKLLGQVQHSPVSVWQKSELYNNEQIMTIVRNPYTRFISHYYSTLRFLEQYINFPTLSPIEFIRHNGLNYWIKMDPCNYLVKQIDYIKDINDNIKCDRIYKMEKDLKILEKDFQLKNINRFKYGKLDYERDYANLYNDELIQFVQETYKDDFEYFGYDKEPFW